MQKTQFRLSCNSCLNKACKAGAYRRGLVVIYISADAHSEKYFLSPSDFVVQTFSWLAEFLIFFILVKEKFTWKATDLEIFFVVLSLGE